MQDIIADASVIIKLFIKEEYTDAALEMINAYVSGDLTITIPSLLVYEVINAVKYSKSKKFNTEQIALIASTLENYAFTTVHPTQEVLKEAIRVSVKHDISIYDAVYVALASTRKATLYTADQKLIEATKLPFVKHIKTFKKPKS